MLLVNFAPTRFLASISLVKQLSHQPLLRRLIQLTSQFDINPMEHMTAPQIYQSQTFEHETLTKKWIEIQ